MDRLQETQSPAETVEQEEERCCCMCGDVGFSKDLLPCPVCRTRLQHTYCSRMYPRFDVGRWRCEWCLHSDQQQQIHFLASKKHKEVKLISPKRPRHRGVGDEAGDADCNLRRRHPKHGGGAETGEFVSSDDSTETPPSDGERWRKPNCTPPSPRVAARRYKLLADVLC